MSSQLTSKYIKLVSFLNERREKYKKEAENSNNSIGIRNMFGTMELEIEQLLRSVDELEEDPVEFRALRRFRQIQICLNECEPGCDCLSPY
jgi:hypothetical protein